MKRFRIDLMLVDGTPTLQPSELYVYAEDPEHAGLLFRANLGHKVDTELLHGATFAEIDGHGREVCRYTAVRTEDYPLPQ